MQGLNDHKAQLRREMKALRDSLSADEKREKDSAIRQLFLESDVYHAVSTVLLYASLPREIDTFELITFALQQGKTVLLPPLHPWHAGDALSSDRFSG